MFFFLFVFFVYGNNTNDSYIMSVIVFLPIYCVQCFFGYKTEFCSFLNNLKNLDPSYKTELDLWDC